MKIDYAEEPYIQANIITPVSYLGPIINLCIDRRGTQVGMNYLDAKRVELIYEMPLAEVLLNSTTASNPSAAAMPLLTTMSSGTGEPIWFGWTFW